MTARLAFFISFILHLLILWLIASSSIAMKKPKKESAPLKATLYFPSPAKPQLLEPIAPSKETPLAINEPALKPSIDDKSQRPTRLEADFPAPPTEIPLTKPTMNITEATRQALSVLQKNTDIDRITCESASTKQLKGFINKHRNKTTQIKSGENN